MTRPLVIVPVDAAPETERSVEYAVRVAAQRGADLHAVHVVLGRGALWYASEPDTRLRARLRALRPAAEALGVRLRIVTLRGVPERVVPAYAQLNQARLIVVGGRYGSCRLWRHAGVVRRLSRSAPVPVLVVPDGRATAGEVPARRIVAAVDFTVASAIALRASADMARRHGARLTILHALNTSRHMVPSGGEAWHLLHGLPMRTEAVGERLRRKALAWGADADPVVVTDEVHRGIVETAARTAADLIVMGVSSRSWFDELVSGSTLRAVLRRATTPVLVLPVVAGGHEWHEWMPLR